MGGEIECLQHRAGEVPHTQVGGWGGLHDDTLLVVTVPPANTVRATGRLAPQPVVSRGFTAERAVYPQLANNGLEHLDDVDVFTLGVLARAL